MIEQPAYGLLDARDEVVGPHNSEALTLVVSAGTRADGEEVIGQVR